MLGAIHNFHKCTESTLFAYPLSPTQKHIIKMLLF